MYWARFAILILASMILQVSLLAGLAIGKTHVQPDLLLILMAYFGAYATTPDAVITSFAIGLCADLIGWTLGPLTIAFGLIGTSVAYIRRYVTIQRPYQKAIVIFITGVATALLGRAFSSIKGVPVPVPTTTHLVLGPLYSAIIGPLVIVPVEWLMRLHDKKYRMGLR